MLPMRPGNFKHPVLRADPREPPAPVMPQGPYPEDMDDPPGSADMTLALAPWTNSA